MSLPLRPGDPLPALLGLDVAALSGSWWVAVVVDARRVALDVPPLVAAARARAGRELAVRVIAVGIDLSDDPQMVADPDGALARRLGAMPASGQLEALAVLIEPGGRVG